MALYGKKKMARNSSLNGGTQLCDNSVEDRMPTYRLICALCETIVAEDVELEKSIELAKEHEANWHSNKGTCYVKPYEPQKTLCEDGPAVNGVNSRPDSPSLSLQEK